jgi:uncharacterized repeat protein (TIGR04138 family)
MHASNFDGTLEQILQKDPRYHRDAYQFVREALDYTQKAAPKSTKQEGRPAEVRKGRAPEEQHVTGQELLVGIRSFTLESFGPMAMTVLQEWGIRRCEDFGEIVFNMVEHNLLGKTEHDSREDFKGGYDFDEVFRKPFLPSSALTALPAEPKSTGA